MTDLTKPIQDLLDALTQNPPVTALMVEEAQQALDKVNSLKVYVQDMGWAGVLAVIASSKEEGEDLIGESYWSREGDDIEELPIQPGWIVENSGDQ